MLKKLLISMIFVLNASQAYSWDLGLSKGKFLDVDQSYIEWRKYQNWRNTNTPYKDDWEWTSEVHNTVSLWKRFYFDSNFHMSMDSTQIRWVGLEYYLGLRVMPYLHFIKYHHSQHCSDMECGQWPLEDSYGIRLIFKGF